MHEVVCAYFYYVYMPCLAYYQIYRLTIQLFSITHKILCVVFNHSDQLHRSFITEIFEKVSLTSSGKSLPRNQIKNSER